MVGHFWGTEAVRLQGNLSCGTHIVAVNVICRHTSTGETTKSNSSAEATLYSFSFKLSVSINVKMRGKEWY